MKRSRELTPLSHDHHQALFVAMKLKRAEDESAAAAFLDFFDSHGNLHFRIEEEILLPAWIEHDTGADSEQAARVLREHLEIRGRARLMRAGAASLEQVRELGDLLERHVRFEERELFPAIESGIEGPALADVGGEIARAEGR